MKRRGFLKALSSLALGCALATPFKVLSKEEVPGLVGDSLGGDEMGTWAVTYTNANVDLVDGIFKISPEDTPFYSMTTNGPGHSWTKRTIW